MFSVLPLTAVWRASCTSVDLHDSATVPLANNAVAPDYYRTSRSDVPDRPMETKCIIEMMPPSSEIILSIDEIPAIEKPHRSTNKNLKGSESQLQPASSFRKPALGAQMPARREYGFKVATAE